MSILHMLDTGTAKYVIKGDREARARLADISPVLVCISVVARAELLYGLKGLPLDSLRHLGVGRFLSVVPSLPWDNSAAQHYADIRRRLTIAGKLIGDLDMMIGAHCLSRGAVLVTNNSRHFSRIGHPLVLIDWKSRPADSPGA